ncbi:MAG TPA: periplasmic heavy metal sensor [Pyrinomonadaceae bacterium]
MIFRRSILLLAAVLIFTITHFAYAQNVAPTAADQIEQLRLTPEQRQRIRMIFEETKNDRQRINRTLREANVALDLSLDADPIDEALIDQRLNQLAAAQAAQMRMRIQTELRIRRELNSEQLATLRRLRLQARDFINGQRPLNQRPVNPRRNLPQP